nr:lytic transglycosylase domain-containing protein [Bartonella australis]
MLAAGILFPSAYAQTVFLPEKIPVPLSHPYPLATTKKHKNPLKPARDILDKTPTISSPTAANQLKIGLDALKNNNITKVIAIRNTMAKDSLERQILMWAIGTSGQPDIPSSELLSALKELKEWPGLSIIRRNAERAFVNETSSAQAIIQKFARHLPLTTQGTAAFAQALIATGQTAHARKIIVPLWYKAKLSAQEEELILKKAGAVLKPIDHLKRMRVMLYARRFNSAKRVAKLARAQSLFDAFIAVETNNPRAAQKLQAVNRSWKKDPLLQFAQIRYLRRNKQYNAAATLMLKAHQNSACLICSDAWWVERRALSREMIDLNKPQIAYQIVAARGDSTPESMVDAEFHAGWYALQFLHNANLAMHHFMRILQLSSTPLSISRGYYWAGRTAEILGEHEKASRYFYHASHFSKTYYGQLAASRLNQKKLKISFPKPTTIDREHFSARKAVQAIQWLEAAGYVNFSKILYRELSKKIESPGELALLAVMAEKKGDYNTSLIIGKIAVFQGKNVGALSHPIGAIPASANILAAEKALIYAIARQESEFNQKAVSKAGARGILQLLPTTAQALANKYSIAWSPKKFTSDISYNTTLGSRFLSEQLERFNGSYILAIVSYNAGPRRVDEWISRYGDPRGQPLNKVIDWIERIPYAETRNYVMRVMENYEIYKARLTGEIDIKIDLISGH